MMDLVTLGIALYTSFYSLDGCNETISSYPRKSHMQFPPHMSPAALSAGLKARKYVRGTLRCKRDDWTECYVIVHSEDKTSARRAVVVSGRLRVNRALDGDVVALELMSTVRDAADEPAVDDRVQTEGNVEAVDECAQPTVASLEGLAADSAEGGASGQLYGRVVGIIRRNWRQYAGVLDATQVMGDIVEGDATTVSFIPVY
jgi:exosome complex exonuclease DIS3/RRP44